MDSASTMGDLRGLETARRSRLFRRGGLVLLLLLPILSLFGLFGPSERTVRTADAAQQLTMTYGSVVRSGEAVPMEIELTRSGGFDGPVTLVFEQQVFDRLDFQNWFPNPSAEVGEGDTVTYEFDPPEGDTLGVSLDARVAPAQWGSRDTYALWVDVDGERTLVTDYTVWVIP
ncbi:MAG TPA: hypothetical protein VLA97_00905 [Nocardioidaceae bacterium]|nr:hypothetical protein [Nocardioidaceae bacterium]HSE69286.1 hypothetical protein [Nocardioidaceae bacterium]